MASCDEGTKELGGVKDQADCHHSVSNDSDFLMRVEGKTDPLVCTHNVGASGEETDVLDDHYPDGDRSAGDDSTMEQTSNSAESRDAGIAWDNNCTGLRNQNVDDNSEGRILNHCRVQLPEKGTPIENVEAQFVQDGKCVDKENHALKQSSNCTEGDKYTRERDIRTEVGPDCRGKGSSHDIMDPGQCLVDVDTKNRSFSNSALYSEMEIQKPLNTTAVEKPVNTCDILSSDLNASNASGDHICCVNSTATNQPLESEFAHSISLHEDSSSAVENQSLDVQTSSLVDSGNFSSSLEIIKHSVEAPSQNSMDGSASIDSSVTKRSDEKYVSQSDLHSPENIMVEGSDPSTSAPVKIMTQYVFIKKPQKKAAKKQFGVTYRRGFHHFQGVDQKLLLFAKLVKKKKMSKAKAASVLRHLNLEGLFKSRASSYVNGTKTLSKLNNMKSQKKKCQTKNKSQKKAKSEKKATKAREKSPVKEDTVSKRAKRYAVRSAEKNQKSDKPPKKKRECKRKETTGRKKSKVVSRRGPLRFEDKLGILQALDDPTATVDSVGEEFGVSTVSVMKVYKKREEILTKAQSQEDKKGKKEGRQQMKVKKEKEAVREMEVKMEQDADVENDAGLELFFSEFQGGKYSQRRNGSSRKDLTLEEKVNVIHALQTPGTKIVTLAKKFGVSSSAISRLNKNKELVLSKAASGDLSTNQRRARECKDPELDRALLKWYRAIESLNFVEPPLSISNTLLKEKVKELAVAMGKSYFPSDNWILRWKNRHNLLSKSRMICDRDQLAQLDTNVDMADIISEFSVYGMFMQPELPAIKEEENTLSSDSQTKMKKEEFYICEHCGVVTNNKKDKKKNNHLKSCPSSQHRKDLTLEEKSQVVKALEKPGVKMVSLAKKYGVSASAISRIHKNRVDILARCACSNANVSRRRDRGSKEPEVEKSLCDWYRLQHELGVHVSGSMIRDRAREIAKLMGKDFWPSDSWVFRWRMRNNVNALNSFFDCDDEEEEEEEEEVKDGLDDVENMKSALDDSKEEHEDEVEDGEDGNKRKVKVEDEEVLPVTKKYKRGPRSVMCEKCGYVSCQLKNNRIKNMRHAKGCPDLKPRNELTYENRAKMLKALEEPGATLSSVARQFGVSVSSMSRMNQKKDEILSHGMDHGNQKRIRESKEPEVGRQLYSWYMDKQREGIHVTGPKLKEKASKLAMEMGREFKVSSGWLGRWRHRFNIVGKPRDGRRVSPVKKKAVKKENSGPPRGDIMVAPALAPMEVAHESMGAVVNVVNPEPVPATAAAPPPRVLLHQRFQSPWEMSQQPASCSRGMEFVAPQGPAVAEDTNHIAYAYSEAVPRHVFHNMFESFTTVPTVGYQVPITDAGMVVGRDFLQGDDDGGVDHHHHHHHQHQHQQQQQQQQQPQHQPMQNHPHHPSPSGSHPSMPHVAASPVGLTSGQVEEDGEQQRQIMDAFKIMSSFAQKKSLGDQVQAALRTIEMSMKSPARKPSSRNTYTAI